MNIIASTVVIFVDMKTGIGRNTNNSFDVRVKFVTYLV